MRKHWDDQSLAPGNLYGLHTRSGSPYLSALSRNMWSQPAGFFLAFFWSASTGDCSASCCLSRIIASVASSAMLSAQYLGLSNGPNMMALGYCD